ncbi:MAG: hypothetical protein GY906_14050 [bacterium]|nr:hypothetical protein [bacterium]
MLVSTDSRSPELDGVDVDLISLHHLTVNRAAVGRAKGLADLEKLPYAAESTP